jgi:hypothetical protein
MLFRNQPQGQPDMAAAATTKTDAPKTKKKAEPMFVLDTTASAASGPRSHELIVDGLIQVFTFNPGKPLELDQATAAKFLKHDAFWLTDEKGKKIAYARRPKQPDELGAGEKFVLAEDQTVAKYEELSPKALYARCLELPGGEKFSRSETRPSDASMIKFLMDHKAKLAKLNTSKESDTGDGEFTPEAEADDDLGSESED